MNVGTALSPIKITWKELYHAALFERDKGKLAERISVAEMALVLRARELFYPSGETLLPERQAVDAAIHALHILRATVCDENKTKAEHHNFRRTRAA